MLFRVKSNAIQIASDLNKFNFFSAPGFHIKHLVLISTIFQRAVTQISVSLEVFEKGATVSKEVETHSFT